MPSVYDHLLSIVTKRGAGYFVLIDPDAKPSDELGEFTRQISESGADAILVGGSLLIHAQYDEKIKIITEHASLPVILFPGSLKQLSKHADALLYLSLISGRNPNYLINDQVLAAPTIKQLGLEPISTGYMLMESGRTTTAQFMSNTQPIPTDKPDIAVAHSLAAQYLGMKMVYLEAGSGAKNPVPVEVIEGVSSYADIDIIVGGGLRKPEDARTRVEAGASFIVTGNVLEKDGNEHLMTEFADAVHIRG
ncbi:MAG: geranylgeranylglyceryl/heptaprenylglyceryl phosphate synthase [Candidatus Marinimicrobia bacterium]|nr:geranylgeranylglyceryl/heptaprenylglyceryl phosphate synthase [Candidatus Neomarinimicrobiota bacterium]MCF7827509.1 geranylgeranylglyceryl/heptaprenylglyceryl phosphate synthase [Candidatus Neomarinimicrobiota bacterium]MCF7881629.1 geranylgeranylglyceryl/heptaprenylglyceryl phosphate synthase [Candidatus Neomarinimicrobiota bacterium]